jgi:hypothetical protein
VWNPSPKTGGRRACEGRSIDRSDLSILPGMGRGGVIVTDDHWLGEHVSTAVDVPDQLTGLGTRSEAIAKPMNSSGQTDIADIMTSPDIGNDAFLIQHLLWMGTEILQQTQLQR